MGKRQIAAQQTRRKIVAAAEQLIKENGFENVSIKDITNEAGVAKGSFYTYFRKKEDIVCEIAYTRFAAAEEQAKTADDICGQISAFLAESMKYIADTGLNICQQWLKNAVEPEDVQGKEKLAYDTGVIRNALSAAVEKKELIPVTPVQTLAESITTQYYGAVALWAITNGKKDPVKLLKDYSEGPLRAILEKYKTQEVLP